MWRQTWRNHLVFLMCSVLPQEVPSTIGSEQVQSLWVGPREGGWCSYWCSLRGHRSKSDKWRCPHCTKVSQGDVLVVWEGCVMVVWEG